MEGTPDFCRTIMKRGRGRTHAASGHRFSVSYPQRLIVLADASTVLTTKSKGRGYRCTGESLGKSPRQRHRFPCAKVTYHKVAVRSAHVCPADSAKRVAVSALTKMEGPPEAYFYVSLVQSRRSWPQPLCSFLLLTKFMNVHPAGPGHI